ncbi:MAG: DUF975 family protein [Lachnospiraceae bacterium]|nr:DUF975 family protein [Lachnospiraceae bacterium]
MKLKAKDQLLGNYGIAAGSFALLFALIYAVMMILTSAMATGISGTGQPAVLDTASVTGFISSRVISLVISALSGLLTTGYLYMMKKIAEGERTIPADLFYVFKNHPDKVLIISLILAGIQTVLMLPASIISFSGFSNGGAADEFMTTGQLGIDGKKFLLWCILYLAGLAISFVIDIYLSMSYMIYLDDKEKSVADILSESFRLMRGNCFRYFYMMLSFAGYMFLVILSCGIAALWVVPYLTMIRVEFYRDLTGKSVKRDGSFDTFYEKLNGI